MNKFKKIIMIAMIGLILGTCGFITANADEIETDKKTGLATPESIWDNYINNTKDIVENDSELNNWFGEYFKNSEHDKENEKFPSFSNFEKFNYSFFNHSLKSSLKGRSFKNEDDFWGEFSIEKNLAVFSCKTSTNIDAFFSEVEKVARWEYQYFEKTNTIYDFFSDSQKQEEVTTENLEEESEYQDIKNALSAEYEKEEKVKKTEGFSVGRLLKNNIFTIIIMVVVVIGLIVVFIKKKNSDE